MKKALSVILCMIICMSCFALPVCADDEISVYIDGQKIEFDVQPVMIDDRVLVPMRAIFEALGAEVDWDDENQTVAGMTDGVVVQVTIGEFTMLRNMVEIPIDVPAQLISDRTLVPLRAVSEPFGMKVDWDEANQCVIMETLGSIQSVDWSDKYIYYGETEAGHPKGFGALYWKENGETAALGLFENGEIVKGANYYSDGAVAIGSFSNWELDGDNGAFYPPSGNVYIGLWNNGTLRSGSIYYANGESYTGEFDENGQKHGQGTYRFNDGSTHIGSFKDGVPNGFGTFYDSYYDVSYSGNWTNGKKDGLFQITDHANGISYNNKYENYEDSGKGTAPLNSSQDLAAYQKELMTLQDELNEAQQEYTDALAELNDYIMNGDPFETDWAKSILELYGVTKAQLRGDYSDLYNENIDSYAAANAVRQQQAYVVAAKQAILEDNEARIKQQQQLIEDRFNSKKAGIESRKADLKQKYNIKD